MSLIGTNIVQAEVMRAGMLAALIPAADSQYSTPKSSWLTGEFYYWLREVRVKLGIEAYAPEAGDCDDFADMYRVMAAICHRRMGIKSGIAVGVMHFVSRAGPHAINVAITSDLGLIFIEPQTGAIINLTPEERKSAWHVRF